ncbi:MAG: glycosyltransferase, partial [Actinomycetota bacterium]|nr:glycosyltransferase [Actinomycetota bacterium]
MAEIPRHVEEWAQQHHRYRASGEFAAADDLRQRIEAAGYAVSDTPQGPLVTRPPRYATVEPAVVPDRRGEADGADASILVLLDCYGVERAEARLVEDAERCLASVLLHCQGRPFNVTVLDNGVGGAAGDWAADAARGPGIEAIHLGRPVGFSEARALQHRAATGRLLVWLDTGVELTGDVLTPLVEAFADPSVGAAGRWGAMVAAGGQTFRTVDPPGPGQAPRDVHAIDGRLLALRRRLVASGALGLDPAYRLPADADADVS